ncbi:MAG: ABC transporter permease [Thermostichus sp. DRC_bins_24]
MLFFPFLLATMRMATPLIWAGMAGLLSERVGIMNIALEGYILLGAFGAAWGSHLSQNPYWGLLAGGLCGMLAAALHAIWCVGLRADAIVAGAGLNLLALSLPNFLLQSIWGVAGTSPMVPKLPTLAGGLNLLVPLAGLLVLGVQVFFYQTRWGLRALAVGEHPRAAASAGVPVERYRYIALLVAGVLAGWGGAYLSIGELSMFVQQMTAGRGFIALAALICGNWHPLGTLAAALCFGAAQALQLQAQALTLPLPRDFLLALPYLLTLLAVAGWVRRSQPPAGMGQHPD